MSIGRRGVLVGATTAALVSTIPPGALGAPRRSARRVADAQVTASITQLMSEWTHEVDTNYGRGMIEADLLTSDCRCKLDGQWISGREAIAKFYRDHYVGVKAGEPGPVTRQLITNFRIAQTSRTEAKVGLVLLLFFKIGTVPFSDYCDPVEVADVRVDCRRGADGLWRISMLDSDRIFRRD